MTGKAVEVFTRDWPEWRFFGDPVAWLSVRGARQEVGGAPGDGSAGLSDRSGCAGMGCIANHEVIDPCAAAAQRWPPSAHIIATFLGMYPPGKQACVVPARSVGL